MVLHVGARSEIVNVTEAAPLIESQSSNVNQVVNRQLKSGHAVVRGAAGGRKVGLLENAQSGPPFSVITAANTANAFPAGPLRPNLLRAPVLNSEERTIARWFDTTAFSAPAQFTFGNSPR